MIEESKMLFKITVILFFSLPLFAEPNQESYIARTKKIKKQEEEKTIQKLKDVFLSNKEEKNVAVVEKKVSFDSKEQDLNLEIFSQKFDILHGYNNSVEREFKNNIDQSYLSYSKKLIENKQKKESFKPLTKPNEALSKDETSALNSFSMKMEDLNRDQAEEQKNKSKDISDFYLDYTKNFITREKNLDSNKQKSNTMAQFELKKKKSFSLVRFFQSYQSEIKEELEKAEESKLSFFDYIFDKKWFKQALLLPENASYEEVLNEFSWYLLDENNIDFIFESLKPYSSNYNKDLVYVYFDRQHKQQMHLSVLKDFLKNTDRSHILTTGQIIETLNYTSKNRCNRQRIFLAKQNDLWSNLNYSERALYINYLSSKYKEHYPIPQNLLMCVISRESHNLIPSLVNFTRCGNRSSTAVGLTQITINTLRYLYSLKKYSLVEGFENEKSPFRIHDLFVVYPELQIERAMAILTYIKINDQQRAQLKKVHPNSRVAKNIYQKMLYNYYSHPCKARNDNYTKKVLNCYTCLQKKNKHFQTCLKKSINTFTESRILKNSCRTQ